MAQTCARVTSSGTRRGSAEPCFAGGARGQGLGIRWPLLGCPCRLRGKLNILESTVSSSRTSGWGPVVHAVAGSAARGCLRWRWKNSTYFLREGGLWIFLGALVSGSHSPRCSYVSLWLLVEEFHTPAARRGNLDIISRNPSFSAGVSFHRNAWLDSEYMSCVCSRMLLDVSPTFHVKVYLDPEVDSCPLSDVNGECAQSMLQLPFSGVVKLRS